MPGKEFENYSVTEMGFELLRKAEREKAETRGAVEKKNHRLHLSDELLVEAQAENERRDKLMPTEKAQIKNQELFDADLQMVRLLFDHLHEDSGKLRSQEISTFTKAHLTLIKPRE